VARGRGDNGLGPAHNVRPLENRVPDCGQRHVVKDLPSADDGVASYADDMETIRANFHQLASKVEAMRAALQAMGVPITQEEK